MFLMASYVGSMDLREFRIDIPQADLDDLRLRLGRTRWPDELPGVGTAYGFPMEQVKELAAYWAEGFDWRAAERRLNAFPQYLTRIDGQDIHFLHVRSPHQGALPLVLTHGWPGSFAEFIDMVGPLTDPVAHGGDAADAFHVVIPSVPGYTFSGPTGDRGWSSMRVARAWDELMTGLGYTRYAAHGGDGGSLIGRALGILNPPGLVATHVLQLFSFPSGDPEEFARLSEQDHAALAVLQRFQKEEGFTGFSEMHSTRPQTLSYALADSPVGQLAWNELMGRAVADGSLTPDQFLTQVSMYWFTATGGSSARQYYEDRHSEWAQAVNTAPTGLTVFPADFQTIRPFAERDNTNLVYWSHAPRGGHFAALEVPEVLVDELRAMFRPLR